MQFNSKYFVHLSRKLNVSTHSTSPVAVCIAVVLKELLTEDTVVVKQKKRMTSNFLDFM